MTEVHNPIVSTQECTGSAAVQIGVNSGDVVVHHHHNYNFKQCCVHIAADGIVGACEEAADRVAGEAAPD